MKIKRSEEFDRIAEKIKKKDPELAKDFEIARGSVYRENKNIETLSNIVFFLYGMFVVEILYLVFW